MTLATRKVWEKGQRPSLKEIETGPTAFELRRRKRFDTYLDEVRQRRENKFNQMREPKSVATSRRDKIERDFKTEMKDVRQGWRLVDKEYEVVARQNPDDFEKQYVFVLQPDKLIRNFGTLLHERNRGHSSLLYWNVAQRENPELAPESDELITLDQFSTIYLVGHGDRRRVMMAGVTGRDMALQFLRFYPDFRVKRLMIIGCLTGSPEGTQSGELEVPENFTQQFHLWISPHIKSPAIGCNRCVVVAKDNGDDDEQDAQVVEYDCDATYTMSGIYNVSNKTVGASKDRITYYWDGNRQLWRFGIPE